MGKHGGNLEFDVPELRAETRVVTTDVFISFLQDTSCAMRFLVSIRVL